MTTHHAKVLSEYRERELAVLAEIEEHCRVDRFGGTIRPTEARPDVGLRHPRRNEDA